MQSALLGQDDVLAQLTGAYQRFHLPTTLAELEVDINNQVEIDKMIAHTYVRWNPFITCQSR